jgi:peroxisomal enoyl-CoA hydratase 2
VSVTADDALIGSVVDEYVVAVEAGKVLEFARAIQDPAARYSGVDGAAAEGFSAVPAPLTFAVTAAHHRDAAAAASSLGLAMERVVVGEVGWDYERPLLAGDVLHGCRRVSGVRHRDGARGGAMTFVTLTTEFHDRDGRLVLRQDETLIETGSGGGAARSAPAGGPERAHVPAEVERRVDVERRVPALTRTDIVRFAGASGDFNPVHHDEEYARAAGFPTVFAMGQLQAGLLSRAATDWLGLGNIRSYRVRFKDKVWPGDELLLRGWELTRTPETPSSPALVECALEAERLEGRVAVEARVTAVTGR